MLIFKYSFSQVGLRFIDIYAIHIIYFVIQFMLFESIWNVIIFRIFQHEKMDILYPNLTI